MPTDARLRRIREVVARRQRGVVVLEDIHDAHNAAAVFRSADAFGFQRVAMIHEREKPFGPMGRAEKLISAASNVWLDFETWSSTEECLGELKRTGHTLVATVLDEEAVNITEAPLESPGIALMLGNEHRGLSERAVAMADVKVMIPMRGMVQSLNLSVTAAICLHEAARRRAGRRECMLAEADRALLEARFLERSKKESRRPRREGTPA